MKVLMVNKFLYPRGGSETYMLKLGAYMHERNHSVQYFGMESENRTVGNDVNLYVSNVDFHQKPGLKMLTYPLKVIYSAEARKKMRAVLEDFSPDVVHLGIFNYQLTPSILLAINAWRKQTGKSCKVVYTSHDYQLVCPNHMMKSPKTEANCEKCIGGHFFHCFKDKCIHSSTSKSIIGAAEAYFWNTARIYKSIDTMICCSAFMKQKMDLNPLFSSKTITLHNFIDKPMHKGTAKKDYVLYFGRYTQEKGIETLVRVCKSLPHIRFVFAGAGPLKEMLTNQTNIEDIGFQDGEALEKWIREARFSVYPSEWYENCPLSIMESMAYGTPVVGARIGGIPELIDDGINGDLFIPGNSDDLRQRIDILWSDSERLATYSIRCANNRFDTIDVYYDKLIKIYNQNMAEGHA